MDKMPRDASHSGNSNDYDVIVVGGGAAGVPAAAAAAQAGARTLLVEKTSRLGGTTTNAGISRPSFFFAWGRQVISGIGFEICRRTVELCSGEEAAHNYDEGANLNIPVYTAVCDQVLQEAGTELLLHTMVGQVQQNERWRLTLCRLEGLAEYSAQVLIDCTGDAQLVSMAGFPVRRPAGYQPATLSCQAAGYDINKLDIPALNEAFRAAIESGEIKASDGCWHADQPDLTAWLRRGGRNANHVTTDDTVRTSTGRTQLEVEGRQAVLRLFKFLRRQPGLHDLRLDYIHPEVGIRETVTIEGEATVTVDDYVSGRVWDDAVCYSYYPIDLHGLDSHQWQWRQLPEGTVATIPRGALLPRGSRNLLAAGRSFSSDRLANSAGRVQCSGMAMGQAAGALAALACRLGIPVGEVPLEEVWSLLQAQGAIVPVPVSTR